MQIGIYEQLITEVIKQRLEDLDINKFHINSVSIDPQEAALMISRHIGQAIFMALSGISGERRIERQIEIANGVIKFLQKELQSYEYAKDLLAPNGTILKAILSKINRNYSDIDQHIKEITPYTRLSHSELFTGGNAGITLESELRKEIRSADRIDLLVSFIKFKGIRLLMHELEEFVQRGGQLRVITTTYMGATDHKAITLLSNLANTEVKISYNTGNERLHAKAYLFYRNTGFHTAYIGSSNFSRTALTDGLEWNLKITTKEVDHIINKFQKTFDAYWQSTDFENFEEIKHSEKLLKALETAKSGKLDDVSITFFDIKPYPFQSEILERLQVERSVHNRFKNLVVAATGTGKTIISAFDFKAFKNLNNRSRLLFLAHRKEILIQARTTFRNILRDHNFGQLWVDGSEPSDYQHVFASVQTLNNRISNLDLTEDYYDYIIIDECHHMAANSYRAIIQYFKPKILLGLTATPERMDGSDITEDFEYKIAAEIRLTEALNRKLLCPFHYFGISDSIDLSQLRWEKGKYIPSQLTQIYTKNDQRVGDIIRALYKYTIDPNEVRAIGFCATIDHAQYMAQKFVLSGLKSDFLTGQSSHSDRGTIQRKLVEKKINFLFVVDIYNEGVDIPEIDTVLFLRPTESLTIFLQQLGRGLRLSENKDCLTVLDFVGQHRVEYSFESKYRGLIGKSNQNLIKEIEDNFPKLPLGCTIILERQAKEHILENIRQATNLNKSKLLKKIASFKHDTHLELTLANFIKLYNIPTISDLQ